MKVLALTGGVGGAKLALGLSQILAKDELTIVANTGDDFVHLGLTICPDLDSVMYALAGINDTERGWGLVDETWAALGALGAVGGETWFQLGDKDLATHLQRSHLLSSGRSLSEVTASLSSALGVTANLLPMSNDRVSTKIKTAGGDLDFQHYFVREQCAPEINGFYFDNIEHAVPTPALFEHYDAVVICPSNPYVSVDPILGLKGVRAALKSAAAPVIAVSPIIGGQAVKGPAAKMMAELGVPTMASAVAHYYGDLLDGFIYDQVDAHLQPELPASLTAICTQTLMKDLDTKERLAQDVLDFAASL